MFLECLGAPCEHLVIVLRLSEQPSAHYVVWCGKSCPDVPNQVSLLAMSCSMTHDEASWSLAVWLFCYPFSRLHKPRIEAITSYSIVCEHTQSRHHRRKRPVPKAIRGTYGAPYSAAQPSGGRSAEPSH